MKYFIKEAKVGYPHLRGIQGNPSFRSLPIKEKGQFINAEGRRKMDYYSNRDSSSGIPKLVGGSALKKGYKLVKNPKTLEYELVKK